MNNYPSLNPIATGNRIKELRKENHIKIDDIVSFMGFESQQSVYKWQRGESLPTVDNLYALSRLFGTTVDDILVGYDEEEQSSSSDVLLSFFLPNIIPFTNISTLLPRFFIKVIPVLRPNCNTVLV